MIYEVSLFSTYYGQSMVNTWNYLLTGTPAAVSGSFALVDAMGGIPATLTPTVFPSGTMMAAIENLVSDELRFTAISAKAVYSVTDFYEVPWVPTIAGNQTGPAVSPVMTFGFRTSRVRTDIRRGTKRFSGITEALADAGGIISSAGATLMNAVATAMSAVLSYDDEGNSLSFAPIIVKKQPYVPEDSTKTAYRYYPTLAAQMELIATGIAWQPYAQERSQTSRQYGRGQ